MDLVVGKDNNSLVETLYSDITSNTIKNACEFVYKYNILNEIHNYAGVFCFGEVRMNHIQRKVWHCLKGIFLL